MAMISLLWKNFCWKLWGNRDSGWASADGGSARLRLRLQTHLPTLFALPLLSASVNPVMPQHVLGKKHKKNQLSWLLFCPVCRNTRRKLTSRRHRDPPSLKVGLHLKLIWRETRSSCDVETDMSADARLTHLLQLLHAAGMNHDLAGGAFPPGGRLLEGDTGHADTTREDSVSKTFRFDLRLELDDRLQSETQHGFIKRFLFWSFLRFFNRFLKRTPPPFIPETWKFHNVCLELKFDDKNRNFVWICCLFSRSDLA